MSRPRNYYQMSHDERRAWDAVDRDRQDAEYAAEEARRSEARSRREAREAKDYARSEIESAREEARLALDELDETYDDVAACVAWMREKVAELSAMQEQWRASLPEEVNVVLSRITGELRIRSGMTV